MSEIGETFKAFKEERRDKKAQNVVSSLAWLTREGVEYQILNAGNYHILVQGKIDYWPSTGKWRVRGGRYGRGVKALLKLARDFKGTDGSAS